jgi:hypothetical protein
MVFKGEKKVFLTSLYVYMYTQIDVPGKLFHTLPQCTEMASAACTGKCLFSSSLSGNALPNCTHTTSGA